MKQILNQRYCYRINSNFIERNKGEVNIKNISKGIKQRYIVGIGDSNGTRMLRDVLNSPYDEEFINKKKKELKETIFKCRDEKDDKVKKELREQIKKINKEIKQAELQDFICNVEFKSDKHYEKYSKQGFKLNGNEYELLLGTPGGVKKNVVLFVRKDKREEMDRRLENGADFEAQVLNKEGQLETIKVLPSKIMGYKSLTFSASIPVTNTRRVLIVKDVETKFNSDVYEVGFDKEKGEPDVKFVEDKEIVINACDGCGLITPEFAEKWSKDLQLDYISSGFCIRNAWIKGMVTKFDFKTYCKDILKTHEVKDVFGQTHNIDDIDIILNESMMKLNYPFYKSIDEYFDNCDKNGYTFSVTKSVPNVLDNERMLNYQYIQCLDLNDSDIDKLLNKNISEIKEVIGNNYIKSILFGKGKEINDKNVWFDGDINDYHIKALMVDKDTIKDEFVLDKLKRAISKRIDMLKTGKIKVSGNYQIAIGEPIIQLEAMCGEEPKGLLTSNEFYIKYWKDRNVKKVGGFRSPMSCKSNARVMNVCDREEVNKWYGDISNMIIFNAWDTSMLAFNGEDFDADMNFTTSHSVIIDSIFDLPAIDCDSQSSDKIPTPTRENYITAIKNSFGNKVGSVTNVGSSFYDKISLFEKDSREYKELDRRIQCIQWLQQECIDSAKQGKPPEPIPSYWRDDKDKKIKINKVRQLDENENPIGNISLILDDKDEPVDKKVIKEKEYLLSICAYKKPYYFRYIYEDSNKQYLNYINEVNILCLREFRMTLDELINKTNKNTKEREMLKYYLDKNPLSDNPCIVNKIAHKVEVSFEGDLSGNKSDKNFDYTIYMSKTDISINNNQINKIKEIYNNYKAITNNKRNEEDSNSDKESGMEDSKQNFDNLRSELNQLIIDKQELSDTLIWLAYKKKIVSKAFIWAMVGDIILETMLNKNERKIHYPTKDKDGDIKYDGNTFKMVEKIIENKEER